MKSLNARVLPGISFWLAKYSEIAPVRVRDPVRHGHQADLHVHQHTIGANAVGQAIARTLNRAGIDAVSATVLQLIERPGFFGVDLGTLDGGAGRVVLRVRAHRDRDGGRLPLRDMASHDMGMANRLI